MTSEEVEYYTKVFDRLEKSGHHTFNWAAFLFGPLWALYRKMYLYSFSGAVIQVICTSIVLLTLLNSDTLLLKVMEFISYIFFCCLWGFFGNSLYYQIVKQRIAKGYHLVENYRAISFWGALSAVTTIGMIFAWIFMPIGDHFTYEKKDFSKYKSKDFKITPQNIRTYLDSDKENSWPSRISIIMSYIVSIFVISFINWKANITWL